MRTFRLVSVRALAAGVSAIALATSASADTHRSSGELETGRQVPAASVTDLAISGVSCPSTRMCVAVGHEIIGVTDLTVAESWNGKRWAMQPTPPVAGGILDAVSCSSAKACTAVGLYRSRALAEAWNGKRWTVQSTPNTGGTGYSDLSALFGVSCTSPEACTAVGRYHSASTLVERWNGRTWAVQRSRSLGSLYSVSCVSAKACTAVGGENGNNRTLAETWNGKSWRVQLTPNPAGIASGAYNWFMGASCTSATVCMAVGTRGKSGIGGGALAAAWNGRNWHESTPTPGNLLSSVSCSARTCMAVGNLGTTTQVESWNGKRWALQPTPAVAGGNLDAVSCSSANACTAVGSRHSLTLFAEAWNGVRWAQTTPN